MWTAAAIGAAYGLAVGSGFALGPVPRSLGVDGVFSTVTVAEFQTTIYLAHFAFGVLLGLLVHVQRAPARVRTTMTFDDGAASPTSDRDGATPLAAPPELLLGVGAILATIAILLGIVVDIGAGATILVLSIWLFGMWRAHDEHNRHLPRNEY